MNINFLPIIFVRNLKKEYFELPETVYYPFAPINNPDKNGRYLEINFKNKDTVCFIKHKTKDLWLYYKNYKAVFTPLKYIKTGFYYEQPTVCWIKYLKEPTFIIYKTRDYDNKDFEYLIYKKNNYNYNNNYNFTIYWSKYIKFATIFHFNKIYSSDLST